MSNPAEQWASAVPEITGDFGRDRELVSGHLADGERLIAAQPRKPRRDADQRAAVETVLDASRALRDRFANRHADAIYDELTGHRANHLRLPELASLAAERFPGLVPTAAELAEDCGVAQSEKDGREIDQGIFFRALLRSPTAGRHLLAAMRLPTRRAMNLRAEFADKGVLDLGVVTLERDNGATHLTVNNRHCLNAEDNRLAADLETAVDLVLLDEQTRVGVLRGGMMTHPRYLGRRVFSSGLNLHDLREGRISFVEFILLRECGYLAKIRAGLLTAPGGHGFPHDTLQKPWLAVVDSFAIGGGMQLLMVFDRVIAADDAFFSLPAAHEGIVPGVANLRLSKLIGPRPARRVILGGQRIYASDPDASLVCDEVVAPGQLDDAARAAVADLAQPAVAANRRMIVLAEETIDEFRAYLAEFAYVQATRMYSDDVLDKVARR